MGYPGAVAFPVVPGQEDRVRNFGEEVGRHQEEWERLNREAGGWTRFSVFLQETPMGNFGLVTWELDDPSKVRTAFTGSALDTWWLDYLRDVFGVDVRAMPEPPSPPALVFDWRA